MKVETPTLIDAREGRRLTAEGPFPSPFRALLSDLRPRFLPKCRVGRGYRAIARNGRVLLASDVPLEELVGRVAQVRIQTWHRVILPGDVAEPYGILLCVRGVTDAGRDVEYEAALAAKPQAAEFVVDVGGRMVLTFSGVSQRRANPGFAGVVS